MKVKKDPKLLLIEANILLRECAQRFGNAIMSKLSEKTAAEMFRKCDHMIREIENNNENQSH